jgi:hypothetical protein
MGNKGKRHLSSRVDVSAAARQNVARMTSAVLFVIGNSVCAVLISHVAGNISFVDAAEFEKNRAQHYGF